MENKVDSKAIAEKIIQATALELGRELVRKNRARKMIRRLLTLKQTKVKNDKRK